MKYKEIALKPWRPTAQPPFMSSVFFWVSTFLVLTVSTAASIWGAGKLYRAGYLPEIIVPGLIGVFDALGLIVLFTLVSSGVAIARVLLVETRRLMDSGEST